MPAHIPPVLVPYLQLCLQNGSTTLITSVLDTPAHWLTLRFVKAIVSGVDDEGGTRQTLVEVDGRSRASSPAIVVSFLKPFEFWIEIGKKIGLDVTTLVARKQLSYVDGLTTGHNIPRSSMTVTSAKSHSLQDIGHAITTAGSVLSQGGTTRNLATLVIDGLDFVLASNPEISSSDLSTFLTEMRSSFISLVLTASADAPLLHNIEASATPLELEHSVFVRTAAHQSAWILQLRPLETGHARDVSGVIQISRGGAEEAEDTALSDGEWLYQVKGDGSVICWSRGE